MTAGPEAPGSFFGRRKGKALRPGQADRIARLLPQLRVPVGLEPGSLDPRELFPAQPAEIWLESGFGGGEHLAHQARCNPEVGFIGVEPFVNGVAKLLGVVAAEGLTNIRVWDEDATQLLPALLPCSVDRVYILYPDPWPKRRQRKRRFVSDENLALLARVMKPGAELRFATDIDDYAGWALARVFRSPDFVWTAERPQDWRLPWPDWPGTRYEEKARREGRISSYLTFRRV
ncbi:tRNA (guanine(46)-N(7))-methyltransferase TrmB [Enterovirga aerilata]|uniref:tRNA (guanine-N(7)-)-methyltransferase n=1 Tax=Enterovirga aerilata TaxID=2730920 RepID=A0A849IEB4_9HYPH|nr:tRNA (guanine(46)-N(7))-methyltransferase TrmB [Enterovirga sp. DB1703]NNM74400.1 tRNA (guanosine(46)-N7)-methyltransferase TrmB [Enterovirga sp. DB1703]